MATTKKKAPTKRVSRVATAEKAPAGATAWKVRIRTNEAHFVHDIDAAESADAPAEQLDALKFALRRALSSGAFPGPAWVLELHGDADSLGFSIKVA